MQTVYEDMLITVLNKVIHIPSMESLPFVVIIWAQNAVSTSYRNLFVWLFDLIHYVQSTIFQLQRDGSCWVEPVLS